MFGLCRNDMSLIGKHQNEFGKFSTEKCVQNHLIVGQYYQNWMLSTLSGDKDTNDDTETDNQNEEETTDLRDLLAQIGGLAGQRGIKFLLPQKPLNLL